MRTTIHRLTLAGTVLLAATALSGCVGDGGRSGPDMISGPDGTAAVSSTGDAAQPDFNSSDVSFAQLMIPHHQQAVEMSTLAPARAADPEVKTVAQRIKAAQDPEIQLMTGWLVAWGRPVTPPSGDGRHGSSDHGHGSMPGMMSEEDMATLTESTGANFDRRFCTMMIAHHEGAIVMARTQLNSGTNGMARVLAQQIISEQQAEINMLKEILARL